MNNIKEKAKQKIDDVADGAKKVAEKAVDKSKEVAHVTGEKMIEGGKRLKRV